MWDPQHPFKPWYRPRNLLLATSCLLIVIAATLAVTVGPLMVAKPKVVVDYRAQTQRLALQQLGLQQDDGSSWERLSKVAALAASIEEAARENPEDDGFQAQYSGDEGYAELTRVLDEPLAGAGIDRERRVLQRMTEAGVFDELNALKALPPAIRPHQPAPDPIFLDSLSCLGDFRALARACTAQARLAASRGEIDQAIAHVEQLLWVSRSCAHLPLILGLLVAQSIDAMAFNEIGRLLQEARFSESQTQALLQSLRAHPVVPLPLALEGERLMMKDWMQHLYSDDGRGNGHCLPAATSVWIIDDPDIPTIAIAAWCRFALPTRQETTRALDAAMDAWIAESAKPVSQRWQSGSVMPVTTTGNQIADMMVPAIDRLVDSHDRGRLTADAVVLLAAIHLHHARRGMWPASLDELAPDILPSVPLDATNDQPFGYRLLSDDAHGRPFLLYSFGADGVDDGGTSTDRMDATDPEAALSIANPLGIDVILNRPRESEP